MAKGRRASAPTEVRRIAAYLRVSTEQQSERETIVAQREAVRDYASRSGFQLVQVFEDGAVSGATAFAARPGGAALLAAIHQTPRPFDAVVVTYLDRLGRDLLEATLAWKELERRGVVLTAINQAFDATPAGVMLAQMLLTFAEFERKMIAARTQSGRLRRVRGGRYQASLPPFGFSYDRATGTLTINEVEATVVRDLYHWSADEGLGLNAIVTRLAPIGVQPPLLGGHPRRSGTFAR